MRHGYAWAVLRGYGLLLCCLGVYGLADEILRPEDGAPVLLACLVLLAVGVATMLSARLQSTASVLPGLALLFLGPLFLAKLVPRSVGREATAALAGLATAIAWAATAIDLARARRELRAARVSNDVRPS